MQHGTKQSLDLRLIQGSRQRDRRKSRPMEDLVRVSVANSRKEVRIRQRALQGVILVPEPGGELRVIAGEDFEASWVHGLQRRLPFDDVQ